MRWQGIGLPRVIGYLALSLIAAGIIVYGVELAVVQRGWENILARPGKSFGLRFILQPAMATVLAVREGIKDARTGRPPYLWTVLSNPKGRSARLHEGIAVTGKIILAAIVIDTIHQIVEFRAFYPGEAMLVAILLAFVPYLLLRGPAARLARRLHFRTSGQVK